MIMWPHTGGVVVENVDGLDQVYVVSTEDDMKTCVSLAQLNKEAKVGLEFKE